MELCEQSVAIDKELVAVGVSALDFLEDRSGLGWRLGLLGNCCKSLGQHAKAIEQYEQSLSMAEELGDRE